MLYPQVNECRQYSALDGLWRFKPDMDDGGIDAGWFVRLPCDSDWMPVPASFNDLTQDPAVRNIVGPVWYECEVYLPAEKLDSRLIIRVGAASHHARIWWNGKPVAEHQGGFLPFEADVTGLADCPGPHRLVIRVDNRLAWNTLPPGVVVHHGDFPDSGHQARQEYFHDFFNYGGIHRSVGVCILPHTAISAIQVTPWREKDRSGFHYHVELAGDTAPVVIKVLDAEGCIVAESRGVAGSIVIADAHLWQPEHPYLYSFEVRTIDDNPDCYRLPVGLRTIAIKDGQLLINEEPFYFRGFGKHDDSELLGKGHSDAVMIKDFALMKWCGANSFRTSHYPYAEETLYHADRTGMVVIGELPAVGINFSPEHEPFFRPGQVDEATRAHHIQTLNEMVARDFNHPSIVLWSLANEAATQEEASRPYFEPIVKRARELDSSRPLILVMSAFPAVDKVGDLFDVIGVNRYYGWYHDVGRLETIAPNLEAELNVWHQRYHKPIVMTEYGADAIAGFHQDPPEMFTEEYQCAVLNEYHKVLDRLPFIIGEHVWNFADFATKQGVKRVVGNRKGVFTRQRQPKMAAHLLRKRWSSCKASSRPDPESRDD